MKKPQGSTLWRRIILVSILGGLAVWVAREKDRLTQNSPRTASPSTATNGTRAPGLSPAQRAAVQGGHPLAAELNAQEMEPKRDLEILSELLQAFTTSLKLGNMPPMGDNADVTAALTGRNRMKLVVIPPSHPSVDEKGQLLDRWGTPYHFHARSAETFDLRSAGPDRVLFTGDDVTWSPDGSK